MVSEDGTAGGGEERPPQHPKPDTLPPDITPRPPAGEPMPVERTPFEPPSAYGPQGPEGPEEAAPADGSGPPKRSARGIFLETLILVGIAAVVAILVQSFLIKAFMIPSSSMSPTLQIGDRVMVERVSYYFHGPRRGDIVVFRYPPRQPGAMNTSRWYYWPFEQIGETVRLTHRGVTPYVKRVAATGGETIELKKGKLYIDGKLVEEDYIDDETSDFGPLKVPEDSLFMLGDNRQNSRDSRFWGTVPVSSVIGRVFLVWWPPSRFGVPD